MARGVGQQSPGHSNVALGERGGVEAVTLQTGNMPMHAGHVVGSISSVKTSLLPSGVESQATCETSDKYVLSVEGATSPCSGASCSSNTGGSQPFNVLPPYLGLNFIIAVVGVYPERF
jgi:microcystin-dependent protein